MSTARQGAREMQFSFGQPVNGVMQMAYVVADIEVAMNQWVANLGIGPWFLLDSFTGDDPIYRGEPCRADVKLAMSFAGHMNVELIQPKDDHPSVYREHIEAKGHGFHHFGVGSPHYATDKAKYEALGYELAFEAGVPTGGKVAYMDTHGALPGYVELIETSDALDETFSGFWKASVHWNGDDPVRPFA